MEVKYIWDFEDNDSVNILPLGELISCGDFMVNGDKYPVQIRRTGDNTLSVIALPWSFFPGKSEHLSNYYIMYKSFLLERTCIHLEKTGLKANGAYIELIRMQDLAIYFIIKAKTIEKANDKLDGFFTELDQMIKTDWLEFTSKINFIEDIEQLRKPKGN